MANQPTKYRKFLAGAATASLVATAVVPSALAASFSDVSDNNSHKEHIDALAAKGIIGGYADGTFGPNNDLTRSHVVKMMGKWLVSLGHEVPADYKTVQRFDDISLTTKDEELLKYSALVKDKGVFNGNAGKLDPSSNITRENMAVVLVRAYDAVNNTDLVAHVKGQTFNKDVTDLAKAKEEARPAIDVLDFFDITNPAAPAFNPKGTVTRGQFASFLNKTINTEVAGNVGISSLTATGAKKLEVKFASAIDTTKASITVNKGTIAVNVDEIKFADDKKSAVITTTTNLTKGEYTVKLSGLSDTAITKSVTVEDQKVSKINVLSTTAPLNPASATVGGVNYGENESAFVRYEVVNQYGERLNNQAITWNQSTGGQITDNGKGQLIIGNTAAGNVDFIPGNKVFLTGVHTASGTVVNAEVVIGLASKADTVAIAGVYNNVTKKIENLPAGFPDGRYYLLVEVKDQYGNVIEDPALSDLAYTSNNPLFIATPSETGAIEVTVDGVEYQGIKLSPGTTSAKGGSATIQLISKFTGKASTYTISAEAKATLASFTLSAPDRIIAEGEKVEIPFSAVDQYGNAVTSFAALDGKITFAAGLALEQQKDGSAKLFYTAPLTGANPGQDLPVYLTSLVADGGNFSSLMVSVKDAAVPTTIVGVDAGKSTKIARGGSVDLQAKDLIIQDQYGRTMTDAKVNAWIGEAGASDTNRIVVTSNVAATSPFAVSYATAGAADSEELILENKDTKITIAGKPAGTEVTSNTERLVFALSTAPTATAIDASARTITYTLSEQSGFVSYEVSDLGTIYNNGDAASDTDSKFDRAVKVYGVEADGTKVLLPTSRYSVTTNGKLDVTGNVIGDKATGGYTSADFGTGSNYADIKVSVLVTINDDNGAAAGIVEKELLVSNKSPKVDSIALTDEVNDNKAFIKNGAITTEDFITDYIDETLDQYGVEISENPVITITKLVKVAGSSLTVTNNGRDNVAITGATAGDKFTATYKYASGKTVSIDFTVEN